LKTICVITNSFNEKGNLKELHRRFSKVFESLNYNYNLLIVDNSSTDGSIKEIEEICLEDKRVKAIINSRNFGHIRSPFYGFTQAEGDAIFTIVSDLQVRPEIIIDFIRKWEEGNDAVIGIRENNLDSFVIGILRNIFYYLMNKLSETPLRKNFIGIGLYSSQFAEAIKKMHDPYPYFRGMIFEVGMKIAEVKYKHYGRTRGVTKNNFLTLYDLAMLGICTHSKIPLRLMTIIGFITSIFSLIIAFIYLIYKLTYWDQFEIGIAPLVISLFFFGSIQLIFLGIIGEYVGFIFTKVENRPLVTEMRRINF